MGDLVYKIFDSEVGEYVSGARRNVFESRAAAKNSCRTMFSGWRKLKKDWPVEGRYENAVSFNDQDRFVIHTFKLEIVE